MVVSDLDGTIVCNGKIPAYTLDVIDRLRERGIIFCVATGRRYRDFIYLFPDRKPIGISLNGAVVNDSLGNTIYSESIDDASIDSLIEFSIRNEVVAGFYMEEGIVSIHSVSRTFAHWIMNEYIANGMDISGGSLQ